MRAGDMVLQSEFVAHWAHERSVAFVGDGDAIAVCVAYLQSEGVVDYGPERITVLDFDERIVNAVRQFADRQGIEHLDARLYNCIEPLPPELRADCFYTNPPWGASNGGESVNVFLQRGMELVDGTGEGIVVLADQTDAHPWTAEVLSGVQAFAGQSGFYVARLMSSLHSYHLDDDPDLRSCNLVLRSLQDTSPPRASESITDPARLEDFYSKDGGCPKVRYVRDLRDYEHDKAMDVEYRFEPF